MQKPMLPMRTVLEWEFFPPTNPDSRAVYLFVDVEGGYVAGWYGDEAGVYNLNGTIDMNAYICAKLPESVAEDLKWNEQHHKELDLSQELAGSEAVISLVKSPKRSKQSLERLDKMVWGALESGWDYEEMLSRFKFHAGTPNERIVRQLWSLRTGCRIA